MHGYNTYYYYSFNIMDRDWDCKCGDVTPPNPDAVHKHILHLCPLYDEECRSYILLEYSMSSYHVSIVSLDSSNGTSQ